jgi:GxxExxY protein
MDADARRSDINQITETILGAAFEVTNLLGAGFLERVYERALVRELALRGLKAKQQVRFPIIYKNQLVGDYVADLLIEEQIIVELKCADALAEEHTAQCINYLKASKLTLAY